MQLNLDSRYVMHDNVNVFVLRLIVLMFSQMCVLATYINFLFTININILCMI